MKIKLPYFILFVVGVLVLATVVVKTNSKVSKAAYHQLVKNHPIQERLLLSKKERKKMGIPPNRYFDDQYLLEMDPRTGKTYPENLTKIRKQKKVAQRFSAVPGQNSEMAWVERGPDNIGGRTRVVFYDPNDTSGKRVFAGGVSGGLWVNNDITNANSMWTQVGIDENLAVSCFAIDPNNSNIWYIGTGEAYTGNDGVGNGIWVTTNGGNTWSNILSVNLMAEANARPYYVNQILAWNNGGTTQIFFSLDGQFDIDPVGHLVSGWWTLNGSTPNRIPFFTTDATPTPYVFSDVEVAADNSIWAATDANLFGEGGGKVFRSTDGVNFTEKYSFSNGERVELAVSKVNANTVYALASTNSNNNVELVKTTDGTNFTAMAKPNDVDLDIDANDFARGQGFYNLTLEVDPTNDNILYAGGIDLFRSTNAGATWSQISKWSNNNNLKNLNVSLVHADHHAVAFNPLNSNQGLFANDGGIYYSSNLSNTATSTNAIQSRNKGYNITQFYSGAIGQDATNEMLLGGTQDNGSLYGVNVTAGINSFVDIYGGDGAFNFIDRDGDYVIVSFIFNTYGAYPLPLTSGSDLVNIANDRTTGSFINVADLDHNLDILYTNGTPISGGSGRISRFTDLLGTPVRKNFTSAKLFEEPTAIKVSPFSTTSSTVFIGTEGASILKVTNLNTDTPTWTNIDLSATINVGSVSDIDFGANENEILVTLHNYGVNNIYYTTDGGITWAEKDGDFPDIPVKAIKSNPTNPDEVIIGTNAGVWRTANFTTASPNWVQSQNGMSSVRVTKFDMRTEDNTVLASTYGRGLFTGNFNVSLSSDNLIPEEEKNSKVKLKTNLITNQQIEFVFDSIVPEVSLQVASMSGHTVLKQTFSSLTYKPIDFPAQPGVYLVRIQSQGVSYVRRIIVVN